MRFGLTPAQTRLGTENRAWSGRAPTAAAFAFSRCAAFMRASTGAANAPAATTPAPPPTAAAPRAAAANDDGMESMIELREKIRAHVGTSEVEVRRPRAIVTPPSPHRP